ncbi:MAG: RNA polymerase sporulation sigma factor SigG [Clostridia bacterium]|nr:RNA polymerase sporulation sigma factor SigG [Clostridia bacterium]
MHYNKVEICGINTAELKVLKEEEKRPLLLSAKNGDMKARESLIDGNLRLVLSIIQRFSSRADNMDDLFQVGCIGLIKAIDNFNTELEVKFSTYAVPMIIGEIRRYLRDNNSIRVSRSMRDLAYKALQAREELTNETQSEPTIEAIAARINEKKEEIVIALEAITEPVSIYEPVYSDSGDALYVLDQLRDATCDDDIWIEDIALKDAIKHLDEREKKIIDMRFFAGKTQSEVAEAIGISQAQVSRLEKGALERIRKQI